MEEQNMEGAAVPGLPDETAVEAVEDAAASGGPQASPRESATTPTAQGAPSGPTRQQRAAARAARVARERQRGPRTPEERQAERDAARRQKAAARRVERRRARTKERATGSGGQPTPAREHGPGRQKTRQGVVVSDRAQKTITVRIDVARRHRRYQKIVRTSSTLHAHDERGEAHIGDTVIVRESRPLSRTKRWRLVEVVERAQ